MARIARGKYSTPEEVAEAHEKTLAALASFRESDRGVTLAIAALSAARKESYRSERVYAATVLAEKKIEARLPPPGAAE